MTPDEIIALLERRAAGHREKAAAARHLIDQTLVNQRAVECEDIISLLRGLAAKGEPHDA